MGEAMEGTADLVKLVPFPQSLPNAEQVLSAGTITVASDVRDRTAPSDNASIFLRLCNSDLLRQFGAMWPTLFTIYCHE